MIKVTTAEVHLTDTTLRQLQAAVEQRMKEPFHQTYKNLTDENK